MTASPRYFLGLRACTCLGASWALCPDASALPSGAMEWLTHANQSIFQGVSNVNKLKDGWNTTVFCSQGGWKDDLSQDATLIHNQSTLVDTDLSDLFLWVSMCRSCRSLALMTRQLFAGLGCPGQLHTLWFNGFKEVNASVAIQTDTNRNSIVDVLLKWWVVKDMIYVCWF